MGNNKQISCKICFRLMRSDNMKRHLEVHEKRKETSKPHHQFYNYNIFKVPPLLNQEYVNQDIAGARVQTLFTEPEIWNLKDEVKDHKLLEDSIEVLKIYKLLQRMKK